MNDTKEDTEIAFVSRRLDAKELEAKKGRLDTLVKSFVDLHENGQDTKPCADQITQELLHLARSLSSINHRNLDKALRIIRRIIHPESLFAQNADGGIRKFNVPPWANDRDVCRERSRELVSAPALTEILMHLGESWTRLNWLDTNTKDHLSAAMVANISPDRFIVNAENSGQCEKLMELLTKDILQHAIKRRLTGTILRGCSIVELPPQRKEYEAPEPEQVIAAIKTPDLHIPATLANKLARDLKKITIKDQKYYNEDGPQPGIAGPVIMPEVTNEYNRRLKGIRESIESVIASLENSQRIANAPLSHTDEKAGPLAESSASVDSTDKASLRTVRANPKEDGISRPSFETSSHAESTHSEVPLVKKGRSRR